MPPFPHDPNMNETDLSCIVSHKQNASSTVNEAQFVWSYNTQQRTGLYSGWYAFTGRSFSQEPSGWLAAIHPDDRERTRAAWQAANATGQPYSIEHRVCRYDGIYRTLLTRAEAVRTGDGAILEWVGTCTDISPEPVIQYVDESHSRGTGQKDTLLETALEALSEGVIIYDQHGQVLWANQAAHSYLGWDRTDSSFVEKSLEERRIVYAMRNSDGTPTSPEEYPATRLLRGESLVDEQRVEVKIQRPDGTDRYLAIGGNPIRDADKQIRGAILTLHDRTSQRQAEMALGRTAQRLQTLAQSNIIGLIISNAECVLEANQAFLDMTGYTNEDIANGSITWRNSTPGEYWERDQRNLEEMKSSGIFTPYEKEYLCKNGERVAVFIGGVLLSRNPLQVFCFVLNIAERKRIDAELAKRKMELETIFQLLPDGVFVYDSQGFITQMNEAARELMDRLSLPVDVEGLSSAERLKKYGSRDGKGRLMHLEHFPVVRALRGDILSGDTAVDMLLPGSDGQDVAVNVSARALHDAGQKINGAIAVLRDITARRRLELEITKIANRMRLLQEANIIGITIMHGTRIVEANQAFLRMIGYTQEEVVDGHLDNALLTPPTYAALDAQAISELMTQGACTPYEKMLIHRNGTLVPVLLGAALLDQDPLQCLCFVMDLTAQKRLEQERLHMVDIVAHELRTPITTARLQTQLSRKRLQKQQVLRDEHFALVEKNLDMMNQLVQDLIDAAKLEKQSVSLSLHPCDVVALCREVAIEQEAEAGRPITVFLPDEAIVVQADALRLRQVIANLLSNALKYSPLPSPVELTVGRLDELVRITVRDEGQGIAAEEQAKLFERFYRSPNAEVLHGKGIGLGIGLYVARTLVEAHGGSIGVNSAVGQGSTFWVELPATH